VAGGWTSASRLRWKAVGGHRLATVALARGLAASEGFGGYRPQTLAQGASRFARSSSEMTVTPSRLSSAARSDAHHIVHRAILPVLTKVQGKATECPSLST
jgi:hypothetical protein